MNSIQEFIDHPQLSARGSWREIGSPVGGLRAMVPPVRMDGVEPNMGDVPALGQHTAAILEELGVDRGIAAAWQREGAV
jgi:itaconate CoA-transferase